MRAAHAIASSREGSSSTVKPIERRRPRYLCLRRTAIGRDEHRRDRPSIPPPKTYTPAAFASSITACVSRPTASICYRVNHCALGNEIRYFAIELLSLGMEDSRARSSLRTNHSANFGYHAHTGVIRTLFIGSTICPEAIHVKRHIRSLWRRACGLGSSEGIGRRAKCDQQIGQDDSAAWEIVTSCAALRVMAHSPRLASIDKSTRCRKQSSFPLNPNCFISTWSASPPINHENVR